MSSQDERRTYYPTVEDAIDAWGQFNGYPENRRIALDLLNRMLVEGKREVAKVWTTPSGQEISVTFDRQATEGDWLTGISRLTARNVQLVELRIRFGFVDHRDFGFLQSGSTDPTRSGWWSPTLPDNAIRHGGNTPATRNTELSTWTCECPGLFHPRGESECPYCGTPA